MAVTKFPTRMFIPTGELAALMASANDSTYEKAVGEYIDQHPAKIDCWVTAQIGSP